MYKIFSLLISFTFAVSLFSCTSDEPATNEKEKTVEPGSQAAVEPGDLPFAPATDEITLCKGADVSWLTQMEDAGIKFCYPNGEPGDCIEILKSVGVNAVRLRVWVNPADKYNALADVLAKARRAQKAGLRLMIDFHYSDSWADPSNQTVPAAWQGKDMEQLCEAVTVHTTEVLTALKREGIEPEWVQVGNETGNGMLWPYGKADENPAGFARLVNAGYDAVKAVCPQAKVIVHLQNGQDKNLYKWLFDILKDNGGRYDVIGMSLYPEKENYAEMLEACRANMEACIARYDKDVMLCEVGMGNAYEAECADFLQGCLDLSNRIAGNRYLGVLYWEPQVYNDWCGYKKGAFTPQGTPGAQLDVFNDADTSVPMVTI